MFGSQLSFVAPSLLAGAVAFGAIAASNTVPALGPTVETAAEDKTIASTAVASGRLDTLVAAVQFAGLVDALTGEGPFTVFAPTDAAFARLDSKTLESLLTEAGRPTLQRILMHHVVAGSFDAADLVGRDSIETLAGTTLELDAVRGRLLVSDAVVESADVDAGNGVVHLIDRVLLPPKQIVPLESLLENAVNRGAPIFNDGDPASCAAIYATALDAVALGSGFGVDARMRDRIAGELDRIAGMGDARDRAWAYRGIIDELFALIQNGSISAESEMSTASARTERPSETIMTRGRSVFEFDAGSDDLRGWRTVLDGVMGGRSTGDIAFENGTLVFTGRTSLENNGGFSSIRTNLPERTFADADAIRLVVKGDGRDYKLGVKGYRGSSPEGYWKSFPTTRGEWTEVIVPIASLERQFMGQRLQGTVRPEDIRALEFYIYDKKAGPFRLEVDSVSAVTMGSDA